MNFITLSRSGAMGAASFYVNTSSIDSINDSGMGSTLIINGVTVNVTDSVKTIIQRLEAVGVNFVSNGTE